MNNFEQRKNISTSTNRNITRTNYRAKRINMLRQRICGVLLFVVTFFAMLAIGEMSAAFIVLPFALYIVFTKEQVLDFGIFSSNSKKPAVSSPIQQVSENHNLPVSEYLYKYGN